VSELTVLAKPLNTIKHKFNSFGQLSFGQLMFGGLSLHLFKLYLHWQSLTLAPWDLRHRQNNVHRWYKAQGAKANKATVTEAFVNVN
jgi:hypothetical protein